MSKLIDIDAIFDTVEINEADVIEATRRLKISETSRFKMATDPEFRKIKKEGQAKAVEKRRVIPIEDYESIIREYYDLTVKRGYEYLNIIADRYKIKASQKLTGQLEKICMNSFNTLPDAEYAQLRDAWETANTDYRSKLLKQQYALGRRQVRSGAEHSATIDSVDATTANKIYVECLTNKDSRTQKNYQELAKKYNVPTWEKVRNIANGHHYSLADKNALQDIEQWRLQISEGNYEMIDPQGNSHMFNTLNELGEFIQRTEGKPNDNSTRNWQIARNWFEKTEPNTVYTKERRTFKGWKYVNHLPAKTK